MTSPPTMTLADVLAALGPSSWIEATGGGCDHPAIRHDGHTYLVSDTDTDTLDDEPVAELLIGKYDDEWHPVDFAYCPATPYALGAAIGRMMAGPVSVVTDQEGDER